MKISFRFLAISIIFLSISALSIALIPLYSMMGDEKSVSISYVGTALLWIGIIGGYITLFLFYRQYKQLNAKGSIGAITFFRNRYASVVDLILILAVALVVVLALLKTGTVGIFSLLFGIVFLLLNLHCIFNGRVYHTLLSKKRSGRNG